MIRQNDLYIRETWEIFFSSGCEGSQLFKPVGIVLADGSMNYLFLFAREAIAPTVFV